MKSHVFSEAPLNIYFWIQLHSYKKFVNEIDFSTVHSLVISGRVA